jgi:predicted sugar kinase
MTSVRVEAPARLHMGMLDVAGGRARRFGGLGVALTRPAAVVEASPSDDLTADGPDAARAVAVARRCRETLGLAGGAQVRVLETIPAHVVLGGLVVEGGVRPGVEQAAPLLARHAMPDEWRCVLAIPEAEPGLSGRAEDEAFARLRPDADRAALIAQLVLTSLLPGVAECDLTEFGAALTRIQRLVGESFASVQGGVFHPRAGALVDALLRLGAAGAGQSSWGPAVYGIVGDEQTGHELARRMDAELAGAGRVELVRFDNRGARVEAG